MNIRRILAASLVVLAAAAAARPAADIPASPVGEAIYLQGTLGSGTPLEGIREGVRYMRDTPSISALMRFVGVYSILGVPYLALMPIVARDQLRIGAGGYGALLACVGIGGVTGALSLAAVGDRIRRTRLLSYSSYVFAALLIAFALVRNAGLAYPILLGVGFTMILNNAVANSTLQHLVPNELRGRLMAAYSFVVVGLSQVLGSRRRALARSKNDLSEPYHSEFPWTSRTRITAENRDARRRSQDGWRSATTFGTAQLPSAPPAHPGRSSPRRA